MHHADVEMKMGRASLEPVEISESIFKTQWVWRQKPFAPEEQKRGGKYIFKEWKWLFLCFRERIWKNDSVDHIVKWKWL